MRDTNDHLPDQELLLYADGEMSQHDTVRVREHLAACPICRTRTAELESAFAGFVELHRSRVDTNLPRGNGLRSSLKVELSTAAKARSASRIRSFPTAFWRQVACAAIALAIVGGAMWRMHVGPSPSGRSVHAVIAAALPNRSLTPGYTRPVKLSELCRMRQPNAPRDEDVSVAQKVFREYGLPVSTSGSYELDYLITPDLGGADDVRNLWPEPYGSTVWNAHVKDELEDRLHRMVCDGQLDLATAQTEIATDWIAAYKRYFHTETPLANPESGTISRSGPDAIRKRLPEIVLSAGRFGFVPVS